jgi:pimeloyl-ACP methyl ester carboxylesterase
VSMAESEVHRRTKLLRDAGVGPATQAAVASAWRCIFTIVGRGASAEVLAQLDRALHQIGEADDLRDYQIADYMRTNPMLSPIPPSMPVDDLVAMVSAERDPQLTYDPAADYAQIRCPVLLQYGADDTSVPVPESVRAITLATADNDLTREPPTIIVYPQLEHMLNIVPKDLVGLGGEELTVQFHGFRFGPTVWSDLIDWLHVHVNPRWPRDASPGASALGC